MSARLHHLLDGPEDAPPLVLSGSLGTNLEMWDAQVPALSERFRLLRYDQRGHGRSEVPPGPYSIADHGQDLLALLDRLELERVSVCGLSIGGMTAMWLAINAPERVERLVLCCTTAYFPPRDQWVERAAAARSEGMDELAEAALQRWFVEDFHREHPDEIERFRAMLRATPAEGYAGACEAIGDMDLRDGLSSIAAPTLVIAGAEDPATPPDWNEDIADAVDGARLIVLDDAAHIANVARPGEVTEAILEHVDAGVRGG